MAENGLGMAGDGGATGDGGGGAPEWPGRVSARALCLGGGCASRLARPAADVRIVASERIGTEERGILGWRRAAHQRCVQPPAS
jgi:hypothetical protein